MVELNPFRTWVPKPVAILFYLTVFAVTMTIDASYSSIMNENVGLRGIQSDDAQWASFCLFAGMTCAAPFLGRVLRVMRLAIVLGWGLPLLVLFEFLACYTGQPVLLAVCGFFIGFVRFPIMLCSLMSMASYLTGKNVGVAFEDAPPRTEAQWQQTLSMMSILMSLVMIIFLSTSQVGTVFQAWVAYRLNSQSIYRIMMLVVVLLNVGMYILMPRPSLDDLPHVPSDDTRWPFDAGRLFTALLLGIACCSFLFMVSHGYNDNWFSSHRIRMAFAVMLVFGSLAVITDLLRPDHTRYLRYGILRLPSARWALLIFFVGMLVNSSSMLVSVASQVGLSLDEWRSDTLGMWGWWGNVLGFVLVMFTFRYIHFRHYFTVSFLLFASYSLAVYFTIQTQMNYDYLAWLNVVRQAALFILFISGMALSFYHREGSYMATWICLLLIIRNVMAPPIGVALYQHELLVQRLDYLAGYATSASGMMTMQGMISAVKWLAGATFWTCVVFIVFIRSCNWDWLLGRKDK